MKTEAFASIFYFFAESQCNTEKIKRAASQRTTTMPDSC